MNAWGNLLCMFCLLRSVGPGPGSSWTQLLGGFMAARLSNSLLVYFTASLINLPFKSLKCLISIKDCFIFEGNISFSENSFLLFYFSFIFISWRLITLQYCSGFWHTLTWINHGFTCIPHPNPPPTSLFTRSLWVFPVHQPWALVSCIQPGLVIYFTLDSIHVSMLFSLNIPPSPSPTESKSLFCTSVSLFLENSFYTKILGQFVSELQGRLCTMIQGPLSLFW